MTDFHLLITDWYRQNSRALPWRSTNDPYRIWLSEVILQQTRVQQGISYYNRFVEAFPTIQQLAAAEEEEVLKLWQGLGYYSRARNLHAAAKEVCEKFDGHFPNVYDTIRALKGVGDYTAAAIASFAYEQPYAVVDGNVFRLLSRYFDCDLPIDSTKGKLYFKSLAQELLNPNNAAIHNQAVMEMGALVCKPNHPNCTHCVLNNSCASLQNGTVELRPVKGKKATVRERFFYFLVFTEHGQTIIERRNKRDIWNHLYQFPLIETTRKLELEEIQVLTDPQPVSVSGEQLHLLTHQRIHARFLQFDRMPDQMKDGWKVISLLELEDYPLPRLIERYLDSKPVSM